MQIVFIGICFFVGLSAVVCIASAVISKRSVERLRSICVSLEEKGR
mgnify:FL=1